MRTDRTGWIASTLLVAGLAVAVPASAQSLEESFGTPESWREGPSLLLIDSETRVRSVDFLFAGTRTLSGTRLTGATALKGPGAFVGVRRKLAALPGISEPVLELFSPVVLQKDLVRLRRLYQRSGFPEARLDYRVALDTAANVVDIDFLVEEGQPLMLGSVEALHASGSPLVEALPEELGAEWERWIGSRDSEDARFGASEELRLVNEVEDWHLDRGYPWVAVQIARADTLERVVDVVLEVDTGPRARVDSVVVEGQNRLDRNTIVRETRLDPGSWYDGQRVAEAEREIFGLDLVRRALVGIPDEQPRDTTVTLRIRVEEAAPRLIWGRAGYGSEKGLSTEAHWVLRNFLGGARTLTTSGVAETGWLAWERIPTRTFGVSANLNQPYLGHRRISASVGPFVEYTDGRKDAALRFGLDASAVYRIGPLRSFSLAYQLSRRNVDGALPLASLSTLAEEGPLDFSPTFIRSTLALSTTFGKLDDRRSPDSGGLVRGDITATTPTPTDVEFVRVSGNAFYALSLGDAVGVHFRGAAGRIFPYGKSLPSDDTDVRRAFAGLRDVAFTGGGPQDVRGWATDLLGPKVPEVVFEDGVPVANEWRPIGALARITGGVEVQLPFPGLPPAHRTYLFFDAGRLWTPTDAFEVPDQELRQDGWFYGTGGGVQFATPAGPIRLGVGYKLNPSAADLLEAGEALSRILDGSPLLGSDTDLRRRWIIHIALGRPL